MTTPVVIKLVHTWSCEDSDPFVKIRTRLWTSLTFVKILTHLWRFRSICEQAWPQMELSLGIIAQWTKAPTWTIQVAIVRALWWPITLRMLLPQLERSSGLRELRLTQKIPIQRKWARSTSNCEKDESTFRIKSMTIVILGQERQSLQFSPLL